MRYFIDLEFIERGHRYPIDLISIGVVDENDREYYAISTEFNPRHASQWVKDNVIACLPKRHAIHPMNGGGSPREWEEGKAWKSRKQIRDEIAEFTGCVGEAIGIYKQDAISRFLRACKLSTCLTVQTQYRSLEGEHPEFWGEWSSYDWTVFCQIFGTMMDLPKGFPMRCNDVIQWAETHLGIPSEELPPSLETDGNHNALLGAKTVKQRWEYLNSIAPDFSPTQFMGKVAKGLGAEVILP